MKLFRDFFVINIVDNGRGLKIYCSTEEFKFSRFFWFVFLSMKKMNNASSKAQT